MTFDAKDIARARELAARMERHAHMEGLKCKTCRGVGFHGDFVGNRIKCGACSGTRRSPASRSLDDGQKTLDAALDEIERCHKLYPSLRAK